MAVPLFDERMFLDLNQKDRNKVAVIDDSGSSITYGGICDFSKEFARLVAEILAAHQIKVYTFPEMRPTPELAFMIRRLHAMSGINITASHNPKEYNGYKAYWEDGCQVSSQVADAMTKCIQAVDILHPYSRTLTSRTYQQVYQALRDTVKNCASYIRKARLN